MLNSCIDDQPIVANECSSNMNIGWYFYLDQWVRQSETMKAYVGIMLIFQLCDFFAERGGIR